MRLSWVLSETAQRVIETLRLPGETNAACADRLLANLMVIALDQNNYEQHFGPQDVVTSKRKAPDITGRVGRRNDGAN